MASVNFCIRSFSSVRRNFLQNFNNVKKLKKLLYFPMPLHTAACSMFISSEPHFNHLLVSPNTRRYIDLHYINSIFMSRWTKGSQTGVITNPSTRKKHRNVRFAEKIRAKVLSAKRETRRRMHKKISEIKENILTVPNALCVIRIVSTPILGYLVLSEFYTCSLGLFVFAGFTDLIDGYIARNFRNQQSMIGSFLDPAADKLLIATLFITLTMNGLIPVPLTSLILFRDACLFGAGFYIRYVSLPPPVNTGIQLTLVAASLAAPVFNYVDHLCLHYLWYITATTTVMSAASYLYYKNSTYSFFSSEKKDSKS
ncbi:UNVERIFIED_CONTAM: putative cardiolipin synthase [Trichonephila clavipes]